MWNVNNIQLNLLAKVKNYLFVIIKNDLGKMKQLEWINQIIIFYTVLESVIS